MSPESVTVLINRMAIVFLGAFNPAIFQPAWFGRHGLLRDAEADAADVELIHPQLTHFRTEWLEVQVTRDRFMAMSRNGGYEAPLLDLVVGTFTILEHTPLKMLGMNREVKLQFDTVDRWHNFGHTLVPKDVWRPILDSPGLLGVQMQSPRGEKDSVLNVFVSATGEKRADINLNDNRPALAPESAASLMAVLRSSWDAAQADGARIVDQLLALVR